MSLPAPDYAATVARPTASGWYGLRRGALLVDRAIGLGCEAIGAALVLTEVAILFAGVVSRYVFDSPIFWTDELANFLFLWLSMIGTVVALRGNGHMRLTTLVNWVRPGLGKWFNSVAALVVIAFVVEILLPAYEYTRDQQFTELTTLGISEGWRAVSILIGMSLAAVIAILRLVETTTLRNFLLAVLVVGGVSLLLWYFRPQLTTMKFGSLFVFFILIVVVAVATGGWQMVFVVTAILNFVVVGMALFILKPLRSRRIASATAAARAAAAE